MRPSVKLVRREFHRPASLKGVNSFANSSHEREARRRAELSCNLTPSPPPPDNQASCHNLWDISSFDDDLAEAQMSHKSCFSVSTQSYGAFLGPASCTGLEVVLPSDTELIILRVRLWDLSIADRARSS